MYADLHIHSRYSDGTDTPGELVDIAASNNVRALAVADHDTVDGVDELLIKANKCGIIGVPCVEISTSVDKVRMHILGYFIDIKNACLLSYLREISKARIQNTKEIFENLCEMKWISYSWDQVLKRNEGKSWLCSLHVYDAMKKDKHLPDNMRWSEFYYKNFGKDSPAYVDLEGFSPEDAIDIIKKANGTPIIAHPKLIGNDDRILKLIRHGAKGLEVYYPAHSKYEVNKYLDLAEQYALVATGGTDWHGINTEWDVELGDSGIDKELFEKLCKENETKKQSEGLEC